MPNAVDLSNEIQGMISHAAMMKGVRKWSKIERLWSWRDVTGCMQAINPKHDNSWKQAIMNEIDNLKKFNVFKIIPLSSVVQASRRDEDFSDCDRIPYKKNENEHSRTWKRGNNKDAECVLHVFHLDTLLDFLLHQHAVINKLNGFWWWSDVCQCYACSGMLVLNVFVEVQLERAQVLSSKMPCGESDVKRSKHVPVAHGQSSRPLFLSLSFLLVFSSSLYLVSSLSLFLSPFLNFSHFLFLSYTHVHALSLSFSICPFLSYFLSLSLSLSLAFSSNSLSCARALSLSLFLFLSLALDEFLAPALSPANASCFLSDMHITSGWY